MKLFDLSTLGRVTAALPQLTLLLADDAKMHGKLSIIGTGNSSKPVAPSSIVSHRASPADDFIRGGEPNPLANPLPVAPPKTRLNPYAAEFRPPAPSHQAMAAVDPTIDSLMRSMLHRRLEPEEHARLEAILGAPVTLVSPVPVMVEELNGQWLPIHQITLSRWQLLSLFGATRIDLVGSAARGVLGALDVGAQPPRDVDFQLRVPRSWLARQELIKQHLVGRLTGWKIELLSPDVVDQLFRSFVIKWNTLPNGGVALRFRQLFHVGDQAVLPLDITLLPSDAWVAEFDDVRAAYAVMDIEHTRTARLVPADITQWLTLHGLVFFDPKASGLFMRLVKLRCLGNVAMLQPALREHIWQESERGGGSLWPQALSFLAQYQLGVPKPVELQHATIRRQLFDRLFPLISKPKWEALRIERAQTDNLPALMLQQMDSVYALEPCLEDTRLPCEEVLHPSSCIEIEHELAPVSAGEVESLAKTLSVQAEHYYAEAWEARLKFDWPAVARLCRSAIALNPTDIRPHALLWLSFFRAKKWNKLIRLLEPIVEQRHSGRYSAEWVQQATTFLLGAYAEHPKNTVTKCLALLKEHFYQLSAEELTAYSGHEVLMVALCQLASDESLDLNVTASGQRDSDLICLEKFVMKLLLVHVADHKEFLLKQSGIIKMIALHPKLVHRAAITLSLEYSKDTRNRYFLNAALALLSETVWIKQLTTLPEQTWLPKTVYTMVRSFNAAWAEPTHERETHELLGLTGYFTVAIACAERGKEKHPDLEPLSTALVQRAARLIANQEHLHEDMFKVAHRLALTLLGNFENPESMQLAAICLSKAGSADLLPYIDQRQALVERNAQAAKALSAQIETSIKRNSVSPTEAYGVLHQLLSMAKGVSDLLANAQTFKDRATDVSAACSENRITLACKVVANLEQMHRKIMRGLVFIIEPLYVAPEEKFVSSIGLTTEQIVAMRKPVHNALMSHDDPEFIRHFTEAAFDTNKDPLFTGCEKLCWFPMILALVRKSDSEEYRTRMEDFARRDERLHFDRTTMFRHIMFILKHEGTSDELSAQALRFAVEQDALTFEWHAAIGKNLLETECHVELLANLDRNYAGSGLQKKVARLRELLIPAGYEGSPKLRELKGALERSFASEKRVIPRGKK